MYGFEVEDVNNFFDPCLSGLLLNAKNWSECEGGKLNLKDLLLIEARLNLNAMDHVLKGDLKWTNHDVVALETIVNFFKDHSKFFSNLCLLRIQLFVTEKVIYDWL